MNEDAQTSKRAKKMLYLALTSSLGIGMVAVTSKEVSYFDILMKFLLQKLDFFISICQIPNS